MALKLVRNDPEITLDSIAQHPSLVEGLTLEAMRPLMAQLEMAGGALRSRWFIVSSTPIAPAPVQRADRLLAVSEAAARLGIAQDTLYRNADDYPFTRRPRPRCLRFSEQGIEEYLRSQQGVAQ